MYGTVQTKNELLLLSVSNLLRKVSLAHHCPIIATNDGESIT